MPALNAAPAAVTAAVVGPVVRLAPAAWTTPGPLLFALLVGVVAGIGTARWKWSVPGVVLAAAIAGAIMGALGFLRPA